MNQHLDPRHLNTAYPTLDNRMEAALRLRKLQVASNLKKWGSKEEESFWMRRTKDFRSYGQGLIPRQKRGWIWAEFWVDVWAMRILVDLWWCALLFWSKTICCRSKSRPVGTHWSFFMSFRSENFSTRPPGVESMGKLSRGPFWKMWFMSTRRSWKPSWEKLRRTDIFWRFWRRVVDLSHEWLWADDDHVEAMGYSFNS